MENIIQKIIAKAAKKMYEVKAPQDDSKFKVKMPKPYEVGKGAEQALADRNQASGAHVPLMRKTKTKQREKNEWRSYEG